MCIMNKKISSARFLQRLKRLGNRNPNDFQTELNRRTIIAISEWVAARGFCEAECSLKSLSTKFGISENQLVYFFETHYPGGFRRFKKDLRIDEAKRLLVKMPDVPLSLIAVMVGIRDKTNFRRQFTEITGLSPAEWRDRNR